MKTLCTIGIVTAAVLLGAQSQPQVMIEWPHTGPSSLRRNIPPPTDITPSNVGQLEPAWQWRPDERPLPDGTQPGNFQATPIMIDDVLYLSTSYNRVVALNAQTGAELWVFDPKAYLDGPGINLYYQHRGVAFWREGNEARVFMNSHDRLFSLDARTGQLVTSFGQGGYAMLREGLRNHDKQIEMRQSSPPVIYKNLVIVGSSIPDRLQYKFDPPGTVQAFDVRSGKRVWVFYTVPESGEPGGDTWENDSWAPTGHANVWAPMSVDETRGLLYVPTSTPSGDYYGGRRPGANLFAETLLCLDAATGIRKWHFQAVHHGLWDYDFPAAPNLVTIAVDGRRIDAVAQVSKQGFTYVFDRVTGQPVWPIEERPVDTTTDVPGEKLWPTQPFPTRPPAFTPTRSHAGRCQRPDAGNQGAGTRTDEEVSNRADLYAAEPARHAHAAVEQWRRQLGRRRLRSGNGPAVRETLQLRLHQSSLQERRQRFAHRCRIPQLLRRFPEASGNPLGPIPVTKPPYAHLVAIDLNKGDIAWRVPFGEGTAAVRTHPLLKGVALPARLGTPGNAGSIVTKGGLVFVGGGERYLYAFDKATGREISRVPTPFPVSATPMTYKTRSGRQFVVVATGSGADAALVSFALR